MFGKLLTLSDFLEAICFEGAEGGGLIIIDAPHKFHVALRALFHNGVHDTRVNMARKTGNTFLWVILRLGLNND